MGQKIFSEISFFEKKILMKITKSQRPQYGWKWKKWKCDLKLIKQEFLYQKIFWKKIEKNEKISKSNFCVPGALLSTLKHPGVLQTELLQGQMLLIYNVQKMLRIYQNCSKVKQINQKLWANKWHFWPTWPFWGNF